MLGSARLQMAHHYDNSFCFGLWVGSVQASIHLQKLTPLLVDSWNTPASCLGSKICKTRVWEQSSPRENVCCSVHKKPLSHGCSPTLVVLEIRLAGHCFSPLGPNPCKGQPSTDDYAGRCRRTDLTIVSVGWN
jgi:hypothetical protein